MLRFTSRTSSTCKPTAECSAAEERPQQLEREKADLQKVSGMKEPIRRTKFIPRVGNWENQAKRQSVALYGDYTASAVPLRNNGKAGKTLPPHGAGGEVVEGDRPAFSSRSLGETITDERLVAHESPGIWKSAATACAASAGVERGQHSQERHAGAPSDRTTVKQPCTETDTEASEKLAAALRSVINETAQLEKDFAGYVVDFECLISAHSKFLQHIDEKLAELAVDEPAVSEAAAVAAAPEQAAGSRSPAAADLSSRADAVPTKWEPRLAHVKLAQKRDAATRVEGYGVKAPFSVKKVPSKWAAAARRKVDRSDG